MNNMKMKLRNNFTYNSIGKNKLGINLTKEAKDLYPENYKISLKETEEDVNKWRDILCLWVRDP